MILGVRVRRKNGGKEERTDRREERTMKKKR
jgi:hypothetical protein